MRVREIFRYPQRDNFSRHAAEEKELLIRREILPSQFLHFCGTWKMRRPFRWNQQLRCASCSCGLFEQLDSDVKLNLIEDEDLGCNEPDCETNHQRSQRE